MAERRVRARDPFFGDVFEEFLALPRVYPRDFLDAFWGRGEGHGELPPIDVWEDARHYVVTAELPGLRREDVAIELSNGALTISGEKKRESPETAVRCQCAERVFGAFTRSLPLPDDADPERVVAGLEDGVLTVTIAKRDERKPRTIDVKSG